MDTNKIPEKEVQKNQSKPLLNTGVGILTFMLCMLSLSGFAWLTGYTVKNTVLWLGLLEKTPSRWLYEFMAESNLSAGFISLSISLFLGFLTVAMLFVLHHIFNRLGEWVISQHLKNMARIFQGKHKMNTQKDTENKTRCKRVNPFISVVVGVMAFICSLIPLYGIVYWAGYVAKHMDLWVVFLDKMQITTSDNFLGMPNFTAGILSLVGVASSVLMLIIGFVSYFLFSSIGEVALSRFFKKKSK